MLSLKETQVELWFCDRGPVILKILSAAQEGEADQKKGDKWGRRITAAHEAQLTQTDFIKGLLQPGRESSQTTGCTEARMDIRHKFL